jgi:hypothetical protein
MEKKKIGFAIFLVIGNIVVGLSTFQYLGTDATIALIAFFTSLSTAVYSIINEPKKPQPLLRITTKVRAGYGMGTLGFDTYIDNIGESSAKDVKVICKIYPQPVPLEQNGVYIIKVIPTREPPIKLNALISADVSSVKLQKIDVEVTYSNMDDETQPTIKETYEINKLLDIYENEIILRG